MNLHRRRFPLNKSKSINIYHLTDTHFGHDGCDVKLLREVIHKIALDPIGLWVHGGDIIDADRPSMRERKALYTHDRPEVLSHEDEKDLLWLDKHVLSLFKDIASKCIGMVDGDHFKIFSNNMTSTAYLCQSLKMPYLGERLGFSSIYAEPAGQRYGLWYDVIVRHGIGAAKTPGGDLSGLVRQSTQWAADAHFGGHSHQENCHPTPVMAPNSARSALQEHIVWHIRGGAFLRGYLPGKTTYVEKGEMNPLCVGWAELHLRFKNPEDRVSLAHSSAEMHVG